MAGSFSDERFIRDLAIAMREAKLDAVVVGMMAAILQGTPSLTQDVDILVRDTPLNWKKLRMVAGRMGGYLGDIGLAKVRRMEGGTMATNIDVILDSLPGGLSFAALKSRAVRFDVGGCELLLASLPDVIASKEAAGREKDRAMLPILRTTLSVLKAREALAPAYGSEATAKGRGRAAATRSPGSIKRSVKVKKVTSASAARKGRTPG